MAPTIKNAAIIPQSEESQRTTRKKILRHPWRPSTQWVRTFRFVPDGNERETDEGSGTPLP